MVDARYNPGTPEQVSAASQSCALLYKYGVVYFSDFYSITAVDALNGTEIWSTYISRESLAPGLSYSYGRVYIVNEAGSLYSIDALTGDKYAYYQFGGTTLHSIPTPYNGSLYVSSLDWNLYCFEEAPPQQFHGAMPTSISVDVAPRKEVLGEAILLDGEVFAQSMDMQTGIPVKVHLTAIDPNNNYQDIAYATCNEGGYYSTMWVPPVPGLYVVTARFEGDQYFMPSAGYTSFIVSEEKSAAQPMEPEPVAPAPAEPTSTEPAQSAAAFAPTEPTPVEPTQAAEAPMVTTEVAIIAVVAVACIIGIVSFWALRKRK